MAYVLMQPFLWTGTGDPNGQIVANRGAAAYRTDGGVGTTFYSKESGDGTDTGWVAHGGGGGSPATQLDADGTILDVNAIADGDVLRRTGTTCVGATCTAAGAALLDDADAAAQRTTLGLVAIASSGSASDLASGTVPVARLPAATTTAIGAVELATDGESAANLVPQANDARLSNARTPTAHASSHVTGGSDVIAAFTSTAAGLVPASGGGTTNFLRADGTFALPPSASGCSLTRISGATGAAGGDLTWQRLSANATANATTTLATVMTTTGLSAGTYDFEYMVVYQSSALTTGVQLVVDYTGTSGMFVSDWIFVSTGAAAATGTADQVAAVITGQMVEGKSARAKGSNPSASAGVDTINADMLAIVKGTIVVTGAGDLQLRHASETANSTQVMANTTLKLCKVA